MSADPTSLRAQLDAIASETDFSGVVRVDRSDRVEVAEAYGLAHRGYGIANTLDTQFGVASGAKAMTALAVVSLVEDGTIELGTTARSLLGDDLPLVDDRVTIEHLLAHRSGIGDYLDEGLDLDIAEYVMPVPVHQLVRTEDFLAVLDGYPQKFEPDERFEYCNGGYVVLALLAERASGVPYHDLVHERVCEPAGMRATAFLRSDELTGPVALGYLELDGVWRSNVFHLPVRGSGDGGIYTTAADMREFWSALVAGRIVSQEWVREMTRSRGVNPEDDRRYGLGFWLHASSEVVQLEGMDAGVSFRSTHDPRSGLTCTVISNTSYGAWPIARLLAERLAP